MIERVQRPVPPSPVTLADIDTRATRGNETVTKVAPPERLLVLKLEKGPVWEQICTFTGDRIPSVPYPRGNEPRSFKTGTNVIFERHWKK